MRYGRGPGVLASFLAVAIFDFFFVPPRFSFAVTDVQYLMTFAVMLAVGLITGQLTAGSKYQAKVATRREQRVRSLYEMSRDLSAALMPEQIAEIGERFIVAELGAKGCFPADRRQRPLAAGASLGQRATRRRHGHCPVGLRSCRSGRPGHQHAGCQPHPVLAAEGADALARRAGTRSTQYGPPAHPGAAAAARYVCLA